MNDAEIKNIKAYTILVAARRKVLAMEQEFLYPTVRAGKSN